MKQPISDDAIVNIINTITEYMYCNWKDCHMEENMTWEDLQKVREEIKKNAIYMIKSNLDNFLTKEDLETWKTIHSYRDLDTPYPNISIKVS